MKVLIADDDHMFTHLITAQLHARGWHVEVAHDAMQAVMYAMRVEPDVIVLDIGMPGGNGFGVLEKLNKSVRTESIPIVVVTNSITPGDEAKALSLGAVAFLHKPVDIERLNEILTRVLALIA